MIDTFKIFISAGLDKTGAGSFEFNRLLFRFEEFIVAEFFRPNQINDLSSYILIFYMNISTIIFIILCFKTKI